ncbi:galactokinase [Hathewaya proteolytica DSM 3090]|uniref:Galactokinase n=1 Tax=Hathewaya proteolytica DSM 3090 TaxID=1121331 RepID=A0A1M6PU04_9CLOT|nr:galactokinase [Hathewaya proteolytica]SHK11392.1 galactokinase [Hathewaya proteolytica DSM 3090]
MNLDQLVDRFEELYGENKETISGFSSPGRVNLIGEHIDYNGGLVFPCALEFGTFGIVRKRKDNLVRLASTNFELAVDFNIDQIEYKEEDDWANYPKGVIKTLKDAGYKVGGMELLISGDIPNGAGLSSSASLEVLVAYIINVLFNDCRISLVDLAKLSQKAENQFVGVNCGIMDQFAVAMGMEKKAILLDCNTLEYKYAPVDLKDYSLVLMNTNKRRALNESKYNERRSECDRALEIISKEKPIKYLCEITEDELSKCEALLDEKVLKNRVRHVVMENIRVKEAFKCLHEGDIIKFGQLLVESHNSLRDLYEVTGRELDVIVEEALKIKGCIGARMTGAGFGGCALAIVKKDNLEEFGKNMIENYKTIIGYEPELYLSDIGDGVLQIKL